MCVVCYSHVNGRAIVTELAKGSVIDDDNVSALLLAFLISTAFL